MSSLPKEAKERKAIPIATGCIDYFPEALAAVAELSRIGNDQHNPGKPLHWDRSKSTDEADALMRHFVERGTLDSDGIRHSAKVAWRALALLQKEIEKDQMKTAEVKVFPIAKLDELPKSVGLRQLCFYCKFEQYDAWADPCRKCKQTNDSNPYYYFQRKP